MVLRRIELTETLCSVPVSCFHSLSPSLILAKPWLNCTVPPQTFSQHGHSKHQSIDALQWPLPRHKPAFHLLMAGRNCFQCHRDAISWVCGSQERLCARGAGEERQDGHSLLLSSPTLSWKLMTLVLSHYGKREEGWTVCERPILNFSCSHLWRIHSEHLLEWLKVTSCCSCLILWHLSV